MPDLIVVSLALFLVAVGLSHFADPRYFVRLVPPWIPWTRGAVFSSGAVEILLGIGLFVRTVRMVAAWAIVGLMTVYVLVHIDALLRADQQQPRWLDRPAGAVTRVLVNLEYVWWALLAAGHL